MKRARGRGLLLGAVVGVCGALFTLLPPGAALEETIGLGTLFRMRGAIAPPPDVLVVAIDEHTDDHLQLSSYRPAWPRSLHARLTRRLTDLGAAVIVFDVNFEVPGLPEADAEFADAIGAAKRVVLVQRVDVKPEIFNSGDIKITTFGLMDPLPQLAERARGLAPFVLPKHMERVARFWTFLPTVDDAPTLPAVALQIVALDHHPRWLQLLEDAGAAGVDRLPADAGAVTTASHLRTLMAQTRQLFIDDPGLAEQLKNQLRRRDSAEAGRQEHTVLTALAALYGRAPDPYLQYYGPPGTIPTVPFPLLSVGAEDSAPAPEVAGKVVFVGWSELRQPSKGDGFNTVYSGADGVDLSGVEIAATAYANLLTDSSIRPLSPDVAAATLLVVGLIAGIGCRLLPGMAVPVFATGFAATYALGALALFSRNALWVPLATPVLVQVPAAALFGLIGHYLWERLQRAVILDTVKPVLPPWVIRTFIEGKGDRLPPGRTEYAACLATDVADYTRLGQSMPPDRLAELMNEHRQAIIEAMHRHGVDNDEIRADSVMATWTAPQPCADVRLRACLAGLDIVDAVARFNEAHAPLHLPIRIGLHTGQTYVGQQGGGGRVSFGAEGDVPNTASRIESLSKHLRTHFLASALVVDGLDTLLTRPIGTFLLVGRSEPIAIHEIVGLRTRTTPTQRSLCRRFAEAITALEAGDGARAAALFQALAEDFPADGPSAYFLDRCRRAMKTGTEVSPVVRMDTK